MSKMYGPYLRRDGRKHVVIIHEDKTRQTKSWPRVLMEQQLGRELLPEETVDHINNDFTDDRLENLQLLSRSDNHRKELARPHRQRKQYAFICPICGAESIKYLNQVKHNWNRGCSGPYCSRSCAGKAQV